MLTKAPEEQEYSLTFRCRPRLWQTDAGHQPADIMTFPGILFITAPRRMQDTLATVTMQVVSADWVEAEQFGCLRQYNGDIILQPGLVHQANGGALIISLRTLLAQLLLWMRLSHR